MNRRVMTTLLLLVAASAVLAPGANAQEGPVLPSAGDIQAAAVGRAGGEPGPNQSGTNWSWKVIPVNAFEAIDSSTTYSANTLYRYTADAGVFVAFLDLPPGTEVYQVCLFVFDGSSTEDIQVFWSILRLGDDTDGAGITNVATETTDTVATPGYTTLCLGTGGNVPVNDNADVDGDGDAEVNKHFVSLIAPSSAAMRWGGLAVQWRRAISPAPATATFPNDVPTTHPYFRFVEALAAAGITAGCATGSYCPDATLTRGQMAVFLSAALGLYWPY